MGHLLSGLLRTPGAGAEYRIGSPLLLDESQTGLFPTGFTRLALIDRLCWIRSNHRDHGTVGSCDQLRFWLGGGVSLERFRATVKSLPMCFGHATHRTGRNLKTVMLLTDFEIFFSCCAAQSWIT